jgi:sugar phosphate isomerase/epimerase
MQASLGVMTGEEVREVRDFAGENDLFIDGIVKLPENDGDVSRFEAEIRTAGEVGVQAVRVIIMPGRRYEQFKTLAAFKEFEKRGLGMLERARPIVEKHRVRLAVENHKDQRIDERLALFERFGGEYIGACLDTGNSFALLDGVYEPVEALAPYAFSVHLKDQAVMEYEDGFLFGDIALGQGSFDLKRIVGTIKESKPKVRFSLELITRDALKVPCLTEQYFATMPDMPAADLARTMRFVREHKARALQPVTALPLEERVKLEDSNIDASVRYAGTELGL